MKRTLVTLAVAATLSGCSHAPEVIVPTATGNAEAICEGPREDVWNRFRAYGLHSEPEGRWRFFDIQDDRLRMRRKREISGWRRGLHRGINNALFFGALPPKMVEEWVYVSLIKDTPDQTTIMGTAVRLSDAGHERVDDSPEVQNAMQRVFLELNCRL